MTWYENKCTGNTTWRRFKTKKSQTLKIHIHPRVGIINSCFSLLEMLQFCIRPLVNNLEAMRVQRFAFSGSSTCQCLFASPPISASRGQDRTTFLLQKRRRWTQHWFIQENSTFSHSYFDSKPACYNFNHNIKLVLQLVPSLHWRHFLFISIPFNFTFCN